MNDFLVLSTLRQRNSSESQDGPSPSKDSDPAEPSLEGAKLTRQDIRRLYLAAPSSQTRAMSVELYRLRGLVGRAARYLRLAAERGMDQSLDITSRNLLRTLSEALETEPAVSERGTGPYTQSPVINRQMAAPSTASETRVASEQNVADQSDDPAMPAETRHRQRLFTWKLVPQPGRGADAWKGSGYRGMVIVRAHDPLQARKLAAEKLAVGRAPVKSGSRLDTSPWYRRSLVRIELASDDCTYDRIDKPSVVYP